MRLKEPQRASAPLRRRSALGVGLTFALLLTVAAPAWAQGGGGGKALVVLTGRAEIRADERVDAVVIFDGPAEILGSVDGPVVALNGDVRVSGSVEEDVVAVNGRAIIESGARVSGDVVSSRAPRVNPGASVEGETRTIRFSLRALGVLFWIAWWFALTVSLLVLGLLLLALAPAMMAASLAAARDQVGPSIGWGVLLVIGVPLGSIVVLFTLVGIPLGLLGLLSLALLYSLGYVVAALAVGRRMLQEPTSRYLAFLAGLLVLRLLGLIPVLGGLVTFSATAYGLGAVAIAALQAARRMPTAAGTGSS